jgi:hypothetical protein
MDTTDTPTNLNLQDLFGLKSCIEVACNRGAFRAEEMKAVGEVYDRLANFLTSVQQTTEQAGEQPSESVDTPQGE